MLDILDVLNIHEQLIKEFGGKSGVRDGDLLESAILRRFQTFDSKELYPEIIEKASALLESLIINHPFIDGNKRVGTRAALLFLYLNGIKLKVDPDELTNLVLSVVENNVSKDEIADYFRCYGQ